MQILLVDDHQLLCVALSEHLERAASRLSSAPITVTTAFTFAEAVAAVNANQRPDFVFLDLSLDGDNRGATTLRRFQEANPYQVPVAVFTGLSMTEPDTVEILRECLGELGAKGILLKQTELDAIFVGLARILNGEQWMPQDLLMALATTSPRAQRPEYHLGLSPREWSVARCLTRGLQDKEIAGELGLSPHYVRQVTRQIYDKLDVKTRTQAAIRILGAPE